MKDYNLNDLLNNIDFESNRLVKINNKLYLTNYQIEILNKYNIDYKSLGNLSSIIYVAEEILEEDDYEDLDEIIRELSERNYYENTNKWSSFFMVLYKYHIFEHSQ